MLSFNYVPADFIEQGVLVVVSPKGQNNNGGRHIVERKIKPRGQVMDTSRFRNTLEYPVLTNYSSFREYYKALETYSWETHRKIVEFKNELFVFLDIVNNPRREVFFSKCWEFGHAEGYDKVVYWAKVLVSIIK